MGTILALVMLYASHTIQRFPRVPDCGASCRLVQGAKASAGTRSGTAGQKSAHASLQGAFAAAAVLWLRTHDAGHKSLARLEKPHGKGQALPLLAHTLARAVYDLLQRAVAFALATCRPGSRRGVGAPGVALDGEGMRLAPALCPGACWASVHAAERLGQGSLSPPRCLDTPARSCIGGEGH